MELITYETIRAVHRAEKDETLQQLPENFYTSVKDWLSHKMSNKDTFSLLEAENTRKLLEDIINRREKKLVLSALRTIRGELPPRNLTSSEQQFFDNMVASLKRFRETVKEEMMSLDDIVEEKIEETKKVMSEMTPEINVNGKKMLKILSDVPSFVGTDMKKYGPFKEGDVVSLSEDIMNLLISRNVGENVMD
ncbi:MAG: hypothetical protein KJ906_01480 [Nanoarchaeota archaeon]|nr:hypothetical protein [Nanoarchaeota archaeon]